MARTANRSGSGKPRSNPAVNQGLPDDEETGDRKTRDPNQAVLGALNADRASPDHSADAQGEPRGREASSVERSSPEKAARSRPTH